jgi:hypothetical protein
MEHLKKFHRNLDYVFLFPLEIFSTCMRLEVFTVVRIQIVVL